MWFWPYPQEQTGELVAWWPWDPCPSPSDPVDTCLDQGHPEGKLTARLVPCSCHRQAGYLFRGLDSVFSSSDLGLCTLPGTPPWHRRSPASSGPHILLSLEGACAARGTLSPMAVSSRMYLLPVPPLQAPGSGGTWPLAPGPWQGLRQAAGSRLYSR